MLFKVRKSRTQFQELTSKVSCLIQPFPIPPFSEPETKALDNLISASIALVLGEMAGNSDRGRVRNSQSGVGGSDIFSAGTEEGSGGRTEDPGGGMGRAIPRPSTVNIGQCECLRNYQSPIPSDNEDILRSTVNCQFTLSEQHCSSNIVTQPTSDDRDDRARFA